MLENPSIRRYSFLVTGAIYWVVAWKVKIRPVRTISRKSSSGTVLDPNWIAGFVDGEGCFSGQCIDFPKSKTALSAGRSSRCSGRTNSRAIEMFSRRCIAFFGCRQGACERARQSAAIWTGLRVDGFTESARTQFVPFFQAASSCERRRKVNFDKPSLTVASSRCGGSSISLRAGLERLIRNSRGHECQRHQRARTSEQSCRILRDQTPSHLAGL